MRREWPLNKSATVDQCNPDGTWDVLSGFVVFHNKSMLIEKRFSNGYTTEYKLGMIDIVSEEA